jgi:hypothetical protein
VEHGGAAEILAHRTHDDTRSLIEAARGRHWRVSEAGAMAVR